MPSTASTTAKRSYDSSRRQRQAAQTRAEVLQAAVECFRRGGWAATTLATIAEAAGVSVETIYKGFGSKKALLREAMDVAIVGDAEPVPYVDRPVFETLGTGTMGDRIARGIDYVAEVHERSSGVWAAIVEAARSDDEIDGWRRALEQGRRLDVSRSVTRILEREPDEDVVTILWLLYSPEVYDKLVVDEGLSRAEYVALLIEASNRFV